VCVWCEPSNGSYVYCTNHVDKIRNYDADLYICGMTFLHNHVVKLVLHVQLEHKV
jgi:hypothetical protein